MFIRLTTLLCVSLYGTMLILGTDPQGAQDAEIASRGEFAPTDLPQLHGAADAGETTGGAPVIFTVPKAATAAAEPAKPEAPTEVAEAPAAPETAPAETIPADTGLLQVSMLDAPAARLGDTGLDVVEVTGNVVNLRAGPSTANEVVARLTRGIRAELISETDNGWMQIRDLNSGVEGYMSAKFLRPVTSG